MQTDSNDAYLACCETPEALRDAIRDAPAPFLGSSDRQDWWHNFLMVAFGFFARPYFPGQSSRLVVELDQAGTIYIRDERRLTCHRLAIEALIHIALEDVLADSAIPGYFDNPRPNGLRGSCSKLFGLAAVNALAQCVSVAVETRHQHTGEIVITELIIRPDSSILGPPAFDHDDLRTSLVDVLPIDPELRVSSDLSIEPRSAPEPRIAPALPENIARVAPGEHCSFCGTSDPTQTLIVGPEHSICADCVAIAESRAQTSRLPDRAPPDGTSWQDFYARRVGLEPVDDFAGDVWLLTTSRATVAADRLTTSKLMFSISLVVNTPLGRCFTFEDVAGHRGVVLASSDEHPLA